MCNFLKFLFVLQFLQLSHGSTYYDDENTLDDMLDENEKDENAFRMLISGGYHVTNLTLDRYVVSIRTRRQTQFFGDNHYCAGTMVGTQVVLTAAHCVMDSHRIKMRPRRLVIVCGTPNRLHHTLHTKEFQVEKIYVHPNFKRYGLHDIAIIMLRHRIMLGDKGIRIMSIAKKRPEPNMTCITAGWGQLFKNGPYAAKIVYLILTIQPHEKCKKIYGDKYNSMWSLCAMGVNNDEGDVCYGDSGGPLVCSSQLAGIVSWGVHCGRNGTPTVFTDVVQHYEWLFNKTNKADQMLPFNEFRLGKILMILIVFAFIF